MCRAILQSFDLDVIKTWDEAILRRQVNPHSDVKKQECKTTYFKLVFVRIRK